MSWLCVCTTRRPFGNYCGMCGRKKINVCKTCKNELFPGDLYCCKCGIKYEKPNPQRKQKVSLQEEALQQEPPKKPKMVARMLIPQNGRSGFDNMEPSKDLLENATVVLSDKATQLQKFLLEQEK